MNEEVKAEKPVVDNRIWKYELQGRPGVQEVSMPSGSMVLTVNEAERFNIALYAIGNVAGPRVLRKFYLAYTGETLIKDVMVRFVGTVRFPGSYVLHVLEIIAE